VESSQVESWLKQQDIRAAYCASEIGFGAQTEWAFDGSEIRHRSGRFFSVAAFEYRSNRGCSRLPLLLQPEIGCLGWIVRNSSAGPQFLLQAKYEPGNCNGTQIAPTVQATKSNQDRVHNGAEVPFLDFFRDGGPEPVADVLQTEESDRFFRKLNRNVAIAVADDLPHSEQFQWCSLPNLKHLLTRSHVVNTDARSALVCLDWSLFCGPSPLNPDLSAPLRRSLDLDVGLAAVRERLALARQRFGQVRQISLSELSDWRFTPLGLEADDQPFSIRLLHVQTALREVPEWSQPMVLSRGAGVCLLALSIRDGVAYILVRLRQPPGVRNGAEIGPSVQLSPGRHLSALDARDHSVLEAAAQGRLLADAYNSQEGSRFFKDSVRYSVALIDRDQAHESDEAAWISLGALKALIDEGGIVSNEMRSAVSFLLPLF
jgi:oxidase EvaA